MGRYTSPIVTTTSPPRETGNIATVPKAYPELMTTHQKDQGYQPSPQSIFAQSEPQEEDTPHALLFQPLGVTEIPPKPDPTLNAPKWPSSRSMNPSPRPVQVLNVSSRSSPYPEYTGTAGPPPAPPFSHLLHGHSRSEPSMTPRLRQLMLPMSTLPRFLSVAAVNTAQKRETCGLLLGKPIGNSFRISTLLIPKQTATENTSTMTHEELVVQVQLTRDLITLGWVSSCFCRCGIKGNEDLRVLDPYSSYAILLHVFIGSAHTFRLSVIHPGSDCYRVCPEIHTKVSCLPRLVESKINGFVVLAYSDLLTHPAWE
jgi:STAM-binding protein